MRANVALHANWVFLGGVVDGLVGQGYRAQADKAFPVGSGLNGTVTDVVSHLSYSRRTSISTSPRASGSITATCNLNFADAIASGGPDFLRLSGGYIYSTV